MCTGLPAAGTIQLTLQALVWAGKAICAQCGAGCVCADAGEGLLMLSQVNGANEQDEGALVCQCKCSVITAGVALRYIHIWVIFW